MQLNVDRLLEEIQEWDFRVWIGGADYATRRPTVGQLGAIGGMTGKIKNVDKLVTLVADLFERTEAAPGPHVDGWDLDQLTAVLSGYIAYFAKWSAGKKADAAATAARAAVEAQALSN